MESSTNYRVVCYGEVLWDVLPTGALPGGAPMNVAYHLNRLGTASALITRIGQDDYGEKLVNLLSSSGVTTQYFQVDEAHPTGLVYANLNDQHEVTYDIVYPSAWDFIEWKDEFEGLVKQADFLVYGSLASRHETSRDTLEQLLEMAATKVLDINLRPPHYSQSLVEYLLQEADILKMNIAELELISSWFDSFQNTADRIKFMQDHFQIPQIIVTLGGDGAIVNDKGTFLRHPGFKVQVADTIGSGDAFLAGFLHQLRTGASISDALAFAAGIGAFIATHSGACPAYELSQVTELMNSQQAAVGSL
jgi:fructokinase